MEYFYLDKNKNIFQKYIFHIFNIYVITFKKKF